MKIRSRLTGVVLAALMVLTVGGVASARGTNIIDTADAIHRAQDAYNASHWMSANHRAIIAIDDIRGLSRHNDIVRVLGDIGCYDEYLTWADRALEKMDALRIAAFGQGTHWVWASHPARAKFLALAVYRRAAARYDTAENALIDCVLDAIPNPPDWVFDLGF